MSTFFKKKTSKLKYLLKYVVDIPGWANNVSKLFASYGQVSIKLRNRGQDAYRPEEYGSSIQVERRINSDGGSSYKIKSSDG